MTNGQNNGKSLSETNSSNTETEFDFQWRTLPSPATEYSRDRVVEFLELVKLPHSFFEGKSCLDAGCGNGRWTFAMQDLGAEVVSFDVSQEAIKACRSVNPGAYVADLLHLGENRIYDFVLCWGVLHHLPDPHQGFKKVASQVKSGGILHVMVYHRDTQKQYEEGRRLWSELTHEQRIAYCKRMARKTGETEHGWWDALNPNHNFSYGPAEIRGWFEAERFSEVTLTREYNINMRGLYSAR